MRATYNGRPAMIGQTVSHYRILSELGHGGMGVVYVAEDVRLRRRVALKLLPDALAHDAYASERLQREARAACRLNHPNICTIHEIEEQEGRPVIVMELLEGESLKDRLARGPVPLREALDLGIQMADALQAAHELGIIHRDIKPANIFLTRQGSPKILDFGLAKLVSKTHADAEDAVVLDEAEESLTNLGDILGTATYMSPEQARGEPLDTRTDIFSLGVVLYQMATGGHPFRRKNRVLTLEAILTSQPKPPSGVEPDLPAEFDTIITKALLKDREQRYQTAGELRDALWRLKSSLPSSARSGAFSYGRFSSDRPSCTAVEEAVVGERGTDSRNSPAVSDSAPRAGNRRLWIAAGGVTLVVTAVIAALLWHSKYRAVSPIDSASSRAIAVLPFQNAGSEKDIDFLRLALADEIGTVLSHVPSFSIRPFATTSKYQGPDVDLLRAAHDMGVASIVTGHFLAEDDQLEVTLEAIDVSSNRSIWRDTVHVAALDKIAMREQVTSRVRRGLVPALGGSSATYEAETPPKSELAYDLYLRSIAVSHDVDPNKEAISMLERAIGIDPSYAPVWAALGLRYYFDGTYGDGGEQMMKRSDSAFEHALALDPNLIPAASKLIDNRIDRGETAHSYAEASALLKRWPESAQVHFTLSYVLRYAGLLSEAAHECETAVALDRRNYEFRSCAQVFTELNQPQRAMEFIRLDAGSEWANRSTANILLGQGKVVEARQSIRKTSSTLLMGRDLTQACIDPEQGSELGKIAQKTEAVTLTSADPEPQYIVGTLLAYCGQKDAALRMLRNAIAHNYCAYTGLQTDPLLAKLRQTTEFSALLSAAKECQNRFLAQRGD